MYISAIAAAEIIAIFTGN